MVDYVFDEGTQLGRQWPPFYQIYSEKFEWQSLWNAVEVISALPFQVEYMIFKISPNAKLYNYMIQCIIYIQWNFN